MMIREIIIPQNSTYMLNLPAEMIGKQIEVIAFEIGLNKNREETLDNLSEVDRLKKIQAVFEGVRVKRNGYKFDRNEANDYE